MSPADDLYQAPGDWAATGAASKQQTPALTCTLRPTYRNRGAAAVERRLARYGLVTLPTPAADASYEIAAGRQRVFAVVPPAQNRALRGRFRLTLRGHGLAGARARIEFLAIKRADELTDPGYAGLTWRHGLYAASFEQRGEDLVCEVLLGGKVGLHFTHIRLEAGPAELRVEASLTVEKIAPYIAPPLLCTPVALKGHATARVIDLQATATARAPAAAATDAAQPLRIAAIAPDDILDDLSREPVVLTTLSPSADASSLKGCDMLLIVPDGQRYAAGWQREFLDDGEDAPLRRLLRAAAESDGPPVVIWFSADPIHRDRYAWLEPLADVVCRSSLTAERITALSDAAFTCPPVYQPRSFNPFIDIADAELAARSETGIFLDGWWNAANTLQKNPHVLPLRPSLSIVDSAWEHAASRQVDNQAYRWNSLGCITQAERALITKFWQAELIVEDETLADTTLARRLREAIGADCWPTTIGATTHERLAGGLLPPLPAVAADPDGDGAVVERLRRSMAMHVARRRLLETATYAGLIAEMARRTGCPTRPADAPLVSIVLVSRRPQMADACLAKVRAQVHPRIEFIFVLHGRHPGDEALLERLRAEGAIAMQFDTTFSLGACVNAAVKCASGAYVAKMDDDDHYGPNYIADLLGYRQCVDYDFVGKPSALFHNEADGKLYFDRSAVRREWRYSGPETERVLAAGAAVMVKRSVFEQVRYPETRRGGADSAFSRACQRAGLVTYSADFFNFVVYRDADPNFHTWRMTSNQSRTLVDISNDFSLADMMI